MLLLCAGNENLHLLTFNTRQQLRVDLADFEGNTRYAEYDNFKVLSAPTKFTLASLGRYGGSAGQYRSENVNFPEPYWYDSSL